MCGQLGRGVRQAPADTRQRQRQDEQADKSVDIDPEGLVGTSHGVEAQAERGDEGDQQKARPVERHGHSVVAGRLLGKISGSGHG